MRMPLTQDGPNDIDVSRMITGGCKNNDFTIGGSPALQLRIRDKLQEFNDIFSCNVKGKAMAVPPMTFTVNKVVWEAPVNRLSSGHISVEKHAALMTKPEQCSASLLELNNDSIE